MMLIAQNHLQLILEVGAMLFVTLVFCLNLIPLSLSVVTFLSLFFSWWVHTSFWSRYSFY